MVGASWPVVDTCFWPDSITLVILSYSISLVTRIHKKVAARDTGTC